MRFCKPVVFSLTTNPHELEMAEPAETWSERFERECEAIIRLLRRRPLIALIFLSAMGFYAWHQFLKQEDSSDRTGEQVLAASGALASSGVPTAVYKSPAVVEGMTAWVYVGTRIDGKWVKSQEDEKEPRSPTLNVSGMPLRGMTYKTLNSLHLRTSAPIQTADRSRPPMSDSKGAISPGSIVKVDDVAEIEIDEIEFRTWIWAHITVISLKM